MRELEALNQYLSARGLNRTGQRETVLKEFLALERHVTAQELGDIVRARHPAIGVATVFRALKLFADAGLAHVMDVGDGVSRYEHAYRHRHHDHIICKVCGRTEEFCSPAIERLQEEACKRHGFVLSGHRLDLFGTCPDCLKKAAMGGGRSAGG
ncbi:MAG TPA: Fur family transcriptional regulator [Elusimicrobiales bacterium]|nr:Fur family transcriptional regulator [Elusimicrobiales bacterium]